MSDNYLTEIQFKSFLQAVYAWQEEAKGLIQKISRSKILYICLLIRYTGMRLGEAIAFNDRTDIDEKNKTISIGGRWKRTIPIPKSGLKKLTDIHNYPFLVRERGNLCRLDEGYVRKIFELRAKDAYIPFRVSPSTIRKYREEELIRHEFPLTVVDWILGKNRQISIPQDYMQLIEKLFSKWEYSQKIGRHNIFYKSIIKDIKLRAFSGTVICSTQTGLIINCTCSLRSIKRFELDIHKKITLSIRSLDIRLYHGNILSDVKNNLFKCSIKSLEESEEEIKAILCLDTGEELCCITQQDMSNPFKNNDVVFVHLPPERFSFIQ